MWLQVRYLQGQNDRLKEKLSLAERSTAAASAQKVRFPSYKQLLRRPELRTPPLGHLASPTSGLICSIVLKQISGASAIFTPTDIF